MTSRSALKAILEAFPPTRFAFAYGSGVFEQPGHYTQRAGRLLDFIFAVDDPHEWHKQVWPSCGGSALCVAQASPAQNIERHRHHYSFLASFGSQAVCGNAEQVGVGVHFNTGAVVNDQAGLPLLRALWEG